MDLALLISQIQSLDGTLKQEASKSVNRLLTIRNWLIGYYIVEYEQKGEDKARYGENLLEILSASLEIKGLSVTNLKLNRLFYITYPQIRQTVSDELKQNGIGIRQTVSDELENTGMGIRQTLSDELQNVDNQHDEIISDELKLTSIGIVQTSPAQSYEAQLAQKIINRLSFSHITLLLPIDDPLKRAFYAIEAIKGTWSVRELTRQINSLLFERSGISGKPEQLLQKPTLFLYSPLKTRKSNFSVFAIFANTLRSLREKELSMTINKVPSLQVLKGFLPKLSKNDLEYA